MPLRTFILQYFIKHFGCRRTALSLMKDFFYSMSQLFQQSSRIDNFLSMCDANCLKMKLNVDMHEYLSKNKVTLSESDRVQDTFLAFRYCLLP